MNSRLVALGLAIMLMLGSVAAFAVPGTTEPLAKESAASMDVEPQTGPAASMTPDLGLLATTLAAAREEIALGSDPSESIERLTARQGLAYNALGDILLTPEEVELCDQGKVVLKLSIFGSLYDGCEPGAQWFDPLGINAIGVQGWLFAGGTCGFTFTLTCGGSEETSFGYIAEGFDADFGPMAFVHDDPGGMFLSYLGSITFLDTLPIGYVVGEFSGQSVSHAGQLNVNMAGQTLETPISTGGIPLVYALGGETNLGSSGWVSCPSCPVDDYFSGNADAFAIHDSLLSSNIVSVGAFWEDPLSLEIDGSTEMIPVVGAFGGPNVSLLPLTEEFGFEDIFGALGPEE